MQFKIIEALSVGCVAVASKIGAALNSKSLDALYVVNCDEGYVDALHKILSGLSSLEKAANDSRRIVEKNYGWEQSATQLKKLEYFSCGDEDYEN